MNIFISTALSVLVSTIIIILVGLQLPLESMFEDIVDMYRDMLILSLMLLSLIFILMSYFVKKTNQNLLIWYVVLSILAVAVLPRMLS